VIIAFKFIIIFPCKDPQCYLEAEIGKYFTSLVTYLPISASRWHCGSLQGNINININIMQNTNIFNINFECNWLVG